MGTQEELVLSFMETQSNASSNSYFEKNLRREALKIHRLRYNLNSSPIIYIVDQDMAKGLFTRREGYACARVTLASGLKLALV